MSLVARPCVIDRCPLTLDKFGYSLLTSPAALTIAAEAIMGSSDAEYGQGNPRDAAIAKGPERYGPHM